MTIGVPLGGKVTVTSNISYLMKGWSERSFVSVGMAEKFIPVINSEQGGHNFQNNCYVHQVL